MSDTKTERQNLTVEKWTTSGRKGLFEACPRFGKTSVGIKIIEESYLKDPTLNLMIVVPSEIIKQHWLSQAEVHSDIDYIKDLVKDSILTSYALVSKSKSQEIETPDLLIIDEIHRYFTHGSEEIRKVISNLNFINFLGMTGVKIKEVLPANIIAYFGGIIDTITEDEAIENGWVTSYIEYNVPLSLSEYDKERYVGFSKPISETLELFRGMKNRLNNRLKHNLFKDDLQVIFGCYSGLKFKGDYLKGHNIRDLVASTMGWKIDLNPNYPQNQVIEEFWNPDNLYERCKYFQRALQKRNQIILHNRVKIEAVLEILDVNPVPTIIFNDSTDMVDEITNAIREKVIAYHSNIKSRPVWDDHTKDYIKVASGKNAGRPRMFGKIMLKKMAIEGMRMGKYKYLVTAKALDEGLDIANVEQIITTSGSTNPITHFQRTSRGKTINPKDNSKTTTIINLYFKDFYNNKAELVRCRDQQKLLMRQKSLDTPIVELNSLSQIRHIFS